MKTLGEAVYEDGRFYNKEAEVIDILYDYLGWQEPENVDEFLDRVEELEDLERPRDCYEILKGKNITIAIEKEEHKELRSCHIDRWILKILVDSEFEYDITNELFEYLKRKHTNIGDVIRSTYVYNKSLDEGLCHYLYGCDINNLDIEKTKEENNCDIIETKDLVIFILK